MTQEQNCECLTEARGVDVRTADYIAKERADAKWRAEKLGWVVLSTEEYEPSASPCLNQLVESMAPAVAAAEA